MPNRDLTDVTEEDLDPRIATKTEVAYEGGPPIATAAIGITSGLVLSKAINRYSATRPADKKEATKFGLKTIATLTGLVEVAGAVGMKKGGARNAALMGGASFVATELVEMTSDFFGLQQHLFPTPSDQQVQPRSSSVIQKAPKGTIPVDEQMTGPQRAAAPNFEDLAAVPV